MQNLKIGKNDKIKVCYYRLDDNCSEVANAEHFIGRCCKICMKYKREVYYQAHKAEMVGKALQRYDKNKVEINQNSQIARYRRKTNLIHLKSVCMQKLIKLTELSKSLDKIDSCEYLKECKFFWKSIQKLISDDKVDLMKEAINNYNKFYSIKEPTQADKDQKALNWEIVQNMVTTIIAEKTEEI